MCRCGAVAAGHLAHEIGGAPCDRRRRIDPVHRPRRQRGEAVQQQRIVGAGQHHGVGARGAVDEARRNLGGDGGIADGVAVQCRFRQGRQVGGADQGDVAPLGEIADQGLGVLPPHRALGAEHRHPLGPGCCAGGLDRRDGADKRHGVGGAQLRHHQGRDGVAGDHHHIRRVSPDQVADQRHHPVYDLHLGVVAVGKEDVVGNVGIGGVRARLHDLAKDGQTAEAGIEHQDGRRVGHAVILPDCRLRDSCLPAWQGCRGPVPAAANRTDLFEFGMIQNSRSFACSQSASMAFVAQVRRFFRKAIGADDEEHGDVMGRAVPGLPLGPGPDHHLHAGLWLVDEPHRRAAGPLLPPLDPCRHRLCGAAADGIAADLAGLQPEAGASRRYAALGADPGPGQSGRALCGDDRSGAARLGPFRRPQARLCELVRAVPRAAVHLGEPGQRRAVRGPAHLSCLCADRDGGAARRGGAVPPRHQA